ncbi:MAG: hypothetical protein ACI9DF_004151 [Verrucomicrobiales bacterium]|jgi:hypothetical protein
MGGFEGFGSATTSCGWAATFDALSFELTPDGGEMGWFLVLCQKHALL